MRKFKIVVEVLDDESIYAIVESTRAKIFTRKLGKFSGSLTQVLGRVGDEINHARNERREKMRQEIEDHQV